jgi:hypothetical protein
MPHPAPSPPTNRTSGMRFPMRIHVKACAFLAMSAALAACGAKTPLDAETDGNTGNVNPDGGGGGEAALFVGTWTCVGGITFTPDVAAPSATDSHSDLATFVANSDGTLALTLEALVINGNPVDTNAGDDRLSVTFSAWGSTATAIAGPTWSGADDAVFTFKNGTFVVTGNAGKMDLNVGVSGNPQDTESGTDSTVMTCTRGVEGSDASVE